jgi:LAO/AO transport system kinase
MIALGERAPGQWRPQIVRAVAVRGEGIDDVVAAVAKHRAWLSEHGQLQRRREHRASVEIEEIALGTLRARIESVRGPHGSGAELSALAAAVAAGRMDPYAAAARLLAQLDGV